MSYFHGCLNPTSLPFFSIFIFFFFYFSFSFFTGVAVVASSAEIPVMGTFSREEMVEIAGYGEEKVSAVFITGSVLFDASFNGHGDNHLPPMPLSGASVGISCNIKEKQRKSKGSYGITNEFGDFTIDLPSNLHSIPNLENSCSVKLIQSHAKSVLTQRGNQLKLSSNSNGIRIFDAGILRVTHPRSTPLRRRFKRQNRPSRKFSLHSQMQMAHESQH